MVFALETADFLSFRGLLSFARKGLKGILPVLTNPLVERGGMDLQISGYLSNRLVAAGYQINRLDLEFTGVRPTMSVLLMLL